MSEKYAFIAAQYADPCVPAADAPTMAQMTGWLGVSKSGYYEWLNRPPSDTQTRTWRSKSGPCSMSSAAPTGIGVFTPSWPAAANP